MTSVRVDLGAVMGLPKEILSVVTSFSIASYVSPAKFSAYTEAPSISSAFAEHNSFWEGQQGSALEVLKAFVDDATWIGKHLSEHLQIFALQEDLNSESFRRSYAELGAIEESSTVPMFKRQITVPANLAYIPPVVVAEAAMPLSALLAAFQASDEIPLALARTWERASHRLTSALDRLESAGRTITANSEGWSFDMARETIDDVVRAGRVVAANAMIMSTSVAQFPVVRASNLAALEAIQASTMSITEPAARLAAEQAAVATFVSTQLQPSLELLKPPVANLGVPVLGHTGGGVLEAASVGQGRERVEVSTIAGNPGGPAASIGNGGMGAESNAAANAAGRGTEAAVQTAGAQPAAVQANPASGAPQQVSALTASHGGTGTGVTGNLVTQPAGVNTAIDNGRGVGVGANIHNQPAHSRTATGQVGHLSAGAPTGGGAPGSFFGRGFSGTGMGRGGHPTQNIGSGSGNQRLPQLPLQAQQAALAKEAAFKAGTGSQAGMMGAAGAPGRGGAMGGMASGGHKGRGGGAGRAALFSYSKEDKEYFKRLFLGGIVRPEGKRTVRRVITRG